MTGNEAVQPKQPQEKARGLTSSGGSSIQRFRQARERSLVEMMSLSDWRSFVPESIALLVVISFCQAAVFTGSAAAGGMPHPFWIPVLLMSSQYGITGGLFAALAATASLFISGLPEQSATQDFFAYAAVVAGQPCAWFGTALVLGGLRTLHMYHQTELQERLDHARMAAEDLADGLERAVGEIERLECRIAFDSITLTSFIHSLAKLEMSNRASLIASIADIIRHGVGATSFAIYLKGAHELEPVLGVENDIRLTATAITPLAPSILDVIRSETTARGIVSEANGDRQARAPHWAPILLAGAAEPIGVVVCDRLEPSQDSAIAARRLDDVCQVFAVLLSACPEAVSEARRNE